MSDCEDFIASMKWLPTTPEYAKTLVICNVRTAWAKALTHERELLPCGHPKACWAFIPTTKAFHECSWCMTLAHERQRLVDELEAKFAKWTHSGFHLTSAESTSGYGIGPCYRCEAIALINRLEGK